MINIRIAQKDVLHERTALKHLIANEPAAYDMDKIVGQLEELQRYRQIGTVKQCREARQKQEPKKYKLINSVRCCPECDSPIKACYDFCKTCGQALKFT